MQSATPSIVAERFPSPRCAWAKIVRLLEFTASRGADPKRIYRDLSGDKYEPWATPGVKKNRWVDNRCSVGGRFLRHNLECAPPKGRSKELVTANPCSCSENWTLDIECSMFARCRASGL